MPADEQVIAFPRLSRRDPAGPDRPAHGAEDPRHRGRRATAPSWSANAPSRWPPTRRCSCGCSAMNEAPHRLGDDAGARVVARAGVVALRCRDRCRRLPAGASFPVRDDGRAISRCCAGPGPARGTARGRPIRQVRGPHALQRVDGAGPGRPRRRRTDTLRPHAARPADRLGRADAARRGRPGGRLPRARRRPADAWRDHSGPVEGANPTGSARSWPCTPGISRRRWAPPPARSTRRSPSAGSR